MDEPFWVAREAALALHAAQLAEHGGLPGLRDNGLLESALARPRNLFAYGEEDLFVLAASLGHGLARNHPFADGNKRTAFVTAALFLELNGQVVEAPTDAVVAAWLAVASGTMKEAGLADWLRANSRPG